MSETRSESRGLRSGALGLWGLAILAAAMMAPALGLYFNWGPMEELIGTPTPLVFLVGAIVILPVAISYSQISSRMTSSGAAYAWAWRELSPRVGAWTGLIMTAYYTVAVILQPILFGLFFNDFLSLFHVSVNTGTWALGVVLILAVGMFATYKGISISVKTALGFIGIEISVVIALMLTIIFTGASHGLGLTLSPFNPGNITGGSNGFAAALIFAILSFAGFEVLQTAAEEAKSPNSIIPRATIAVVLLVGAFWVIGSWVFSISVPVSKVNSLMASGFTPITAIASEYWGAAKVLVDFTGMTALGGALIACAVGASRITYAQGRQGTLPAVLGRTHAKSQVPVNALHVVWAITIAGTVGITLWLGNPNLAFVWWAGSIVFFALLMYMVVHVASLRHFRRTHDFHWFLHGVIPVIGVLLVLYLIYKSFFVALWGQPWDTGRSIVVFGLAVVAVSLIYVLVPGKKLRGVLAGSHPDVIEESAAEMAPAATS